MCSQANVDFAAARRGPHRWNAAAEVALIFLVFFSQAAGAVPAANEPHYLSKAKHYWEPSWCAHDFFCSTTDAHQVFYWTFGWLSRWLPLAKLAWSGRVLTWGLLAWTWRRLSWSLVPAPLFSVLTAAILVALNDHCQMAGEWLIGGVEAKGFAYVLVLAGLGSLVRGRWTATWLLFGTASSFHVIIGGWSVVAALVVWLASPVRPPWRHTLMALVGGLLFALPGLWPALALARGTDAEVVRQANEIYVFERLYHHLLPQRFAVEGIVRHLILVAGLVWLSRTVPATPGWRRLRVFVAAAVGIAALGMAISLLVPVDPDLAASLLRYYWFRMSDVMVPVGVALALGSLLQTWRQAAPARYAWTLAVSLLLIGAHLGQIVWLRHESSRPLADASIVDLAAWREMCAWARRETPADAVFLTPRLASTFRWYAGRAEVVSRKDIPQDASGIVEWWRRLQRLHLADTGTTMAHWRLSLAELDAATLRELGREFGAQYVITTAEPALALERVGPRNASYAIYRLSSPSVGSRDLAPRSLGRP